MTKQDEAGLAPKGAKGAQLKDKITREKDGEHAEQFDPGASMLGTDNEAGTTPDKGAMEQARKAPRPQDGVGNKCGSTPTKPPAK